MDLVYISFGHNHTDKLALVEIIGHVEINLEGSAVSSRAKLD